MKFVLCRSTPQNRTVKHTAVFERIRKSADVNTSAFAEFSDSHLNFLCVSYGKRKFGCILNKNGCAVKSNDILLALAEINISALGVCKDEVVSVFLGVVSASVESESVFFLNAQNIIKLEELALPMMSGRLADTDKSTAVEHKLLNGCDNLLICPIFATRLCCVCIADIDDYIKLVEEIAVVLNIIKADERNIKRRTAQSLDNTEIRIVLSVIKTVVNHMV